MKKLIIITLIEILIALCLKVNAQNRNVIWVHGLGGDETHWEHYEAIFNNERQINSVNERYPDDDGISYATYGVKNDINSKLNYSQQRDSRNLGIGHSMGGVVLRNLDKTSTSTSSKRIGGLITVDSPNYGAPIVNSIQDGSMLAASQNGADKLIKGPLSQALPIPLNIIGSFFSDDICNSFITDDLFSSYGSGTSANNLKPNSSVLNGINSYSSSLPQISISGQENSPVHWRVLGSFMDYGDSDYALASNVNTARGSYNGYYITNISLSIAATAAGFWNPVFFIVAANFAFNATQWKEGIDWIDDSEVIWCSLIKTTRTEQQTYWVRTWIPCDYPPIAHSNTKNIDPDCGHWEMVQHTRNVVVNYPSDGLLPQYTQELKGIPADNKYIIEGANHMEVLDMSKSTLNGKPNDGTKDTFKDIFDRNDWFKTVK